MLQGTGSDVGKSLIAAGLCRLYARRGFAVRPFKPQNMSNNAGATADGGEIGRAQMLQARAAGVEPTVHMNPVLLKPQSETGSQIVVQGKALRTVAARDYASVKPQLLAPVLDSFGRLKAEADLVIVEGAGSPAEVNLRANDIANMGFARATGVPVLLVADIERGGVIANLAGTHRVLAAADAAMVEGFVVNKFRGDVSLFADGADAVNAFTGWRALGIVPYFAAAADLPAEDTLGLSSGPARGALKVVMPRTPHIANFDDADPLRLEPGVAFKVLPLSAPLPADADVVLLPGSKSTLADLAALRASGWDIDIAAFVRRGGRVIGLCGGYQMLGRTVADPHGLEGPPGTAAGLGHLDVDTVLRAPKRTEPTHGFSRIPGTEDTLVSGYRIHMGTTDGPGRARPAVMLADGPDGAMSESGRVVGTYAHGLFASDAFRRRLLRALGSASDLSYDARIEATLERLADHLEAALDGAALDAIAFGAPASAARARSARSD